VITIVKYSSTETGTDDKDYNEGGTKITDASTGTASYQFKSGTSDAVPTGEPTTSDIFYIWNNGAGESDVHDLKEPKLSLTVTKIAGESVTSSTDSTKKNTVIGWLQFTINDTPPRTLSTEDEKINVQSLYQDKKSNTTDPRVLKAFSDTSDTATSKGKDKKIKLQLTLRPGANEAAGQYSYTLTISGNYT